MSRKERLYIQGLPQLIKLKGHNNDFVFLDEKDYDYFIVCIDKALERFPCDLHAYTLLPREVLFLLTPHSKEQLSRLIQHIGRCYVSWYNRKYQRSGALWEGRYNSGLIEPGSYLLLVQQYVDTLANRLNPPSVESKIWSSLRQNIGAEKNVRMIPHLCYQQLGASAEERARQYRRFIEAAISPTVQIRIQQCLSQNCVLGTPKFCQQLEQQLNRRLRPRHSGRPRKYYQNDVTDWVWLEEQAKRILQRYCYREVRLPLLQEWEDHAAFHHSETGKMDLAGNQHALLREEGTTGCLQFLQRHEDLQSASRLWYLGAMFRAPQTSAQHVQQYHQLGAEAFGFADLDIELEQLLLQYHFFTSLQLDSHVELRINTVGTLAEFSTFRQQLRDYYQPYTLFFTPEWLDWLTHTPEKLLVVSDPLLEKLKSLAPSLADCLSAASHRRFERLIRLLRRSAIPFVVDETLYPENRYCHLLIEWHSDKLEAGDILCRGGRYDESASNQLQHVTHACGFAFMLEPIMRLLQLTHKQMLRQASMDVVIIPRTVEASAPALNLGRMLRGTFPQMNIMNDFSQQRLTACKRNAVRQGGRFIVIVPTATSRALFEIIDKESGQKQEAELNTMIDLLGHSLNL